MRKSKNSDDTLNLDDIRVLFNLHLGLSLKRTSIYHYIKNFGFPENTGWGKPRFWHRKEVEDWFGRHNKTDKN